MNNEFQFLHNIFVEWKNVTMKQIKHRQITMQIMYNNEQKLLKTSFQGWLRCYKGQKNYKIKRDLFYKKLLIFNYNYILRKYFNGFVQNNRRLITLHYKKEMANNFRSQRLEVLKHSIFQVLKDNSYVGFNIHKIKLNSLRTYLKIWKQETRRQQLANQLGSQNISDIELWIQQRRQNRIQPKVHISEIKPKQINQEPNLNEYLQQKMKEYEEQTKLQEKNIPLIRQIKAEIKSTLEKIQLQRGTQI